MPGASPEVILFLGRRYQCQRCGAVVFVVPAQTLTKRLYSAGAIVWALALLGIKLLSPIAIRKLVSPWVGRDSTWLTVYRWAWAAAEGRLFGCVRPMPPDWPVRKVAERVATTLSAYARPRPEPPALDVLAFIGAGLAR